MADEARLGAVAAVWWNAVTQGRAWQMGTGAAWIAEVRSGEAMYGMERFGRLGKSRLVAVRYGKASWVASRFGRQG